MTNLHHFFLLHSHVDGGERVTDLLDLGSVISYRQIFLSDIAELLPNMQLPGHCASGENPFEICPRIFWHLGIPDAA